MLFPFLRGFSPEGSRLKAAFKGGWMGVQSVGSYSTQNISKSISVKGTGMLFRKITPFLRARRKAEARPLPSFLYVF